jgi:hypothetical protein
MITFLAAHAAGYWVYGCLRTPMPTPVDRKGHLDGQLGGQFGPLVSEVHSMWIGERTYNVLGFVFPH